MAPAIILAGYAVLKMADVLTQQLSENAYRNLLTGLSIAISPMVMLFGTPVALVLYARRLCVRPLHALLPLCLPLVLAALVAGRNLVRPVHRSPPGLA